MAVLIHQPYYKEVVVGESGLDTSDATATAADIKKGLTAYVDGEKITGSAYTLNTEYTFIPDTKDHYLVSGFYNGIKLTGDADLLAENIKEGVELFGVVGTLVEKGENDVDTSSATATADDILLGKTAYVDGVELTGTIVSQVEQTIVPSTIDQTISSGIYIAGTQTIKGDSNLVAENIKSGVEIFGIEGTLESGIDTSDGDITEYDVLEGKIGYANGKQIIGTIPSLEETTYMPSVHTIAIEEGQYLEGSQIIEGDANLVAENIKAGITIFEVEGTYAGEGGFGITDATATSEDILDGKIAYNNDGKVYGSIPVLDEQIITPGYSDYIVEEGSYLAGGIKICGDENFVAGNIKSGVTIFNVTGTYEGTGGDGIDTSDGTATADDILLDKTAYVNGEKVTGTIVTYDDDTIIMPTVIDQTINSNTYISEEITIRGDEDLIPENIKDGVMIFGVVGTYTGDSSEESTSTTMKFIDCTTKTSAEEVVSEYEGIFKTYNSDSSSWTNLETYSYNTQAITAFYNSTYANDISTGAGFNLCNIPAGSAMYGLIKVKITKTSGLLKLLYYVSAWVNPTITVAFVDAADEEELQTKITSEDFVASRTLTLANVTNNSYTFFESDNLPIGEYYPVLMVPSKIQANESLLKYLGIIFI